MSLDRSMLDHLRDNIEDNPEAAKQELRDSAVKIKSVYRNRTIRREIKAINSCLLTIPARLVIKNEC